MTEDKIQQPEIQNEEKKPIYKQTKGILGIIIVCCVAVLIILAATGMLMPDKTTGTSTSSSGSAGSSDQVYADGTYKVGTDLPAGEYKFTQTSSIGGYIERSSDSSMEVDSIIANDLTNEMGESKYITINEGEYVKVQGGELVKV